MIKHLKKLYRENNNSVAEPSRINVAFVARLIYQENHWIKEVLLKHYKIIMGEKMMEEEFNTVSSLVDLGILERIDLTGKKATYNPEYIVQYDVNKWKKDKFKNPIYDYKISKKKI